VIRTPSRRLTAACLLLALAAIGGVYFAFFPGATPLDRLGEWVIPNESHSHVLRWTVARGLPIALVLGAALSCVTAVFWDRRRAVTCVVAPPVAIALTEYVLKPLVGRSVPGVGVIGFAYPSGHMTAAAAVVGVAVLVVPPRWRRLALLIGTVLDVFVAVCLILLRYHYVTDIIAGTAVALGTTILVDTALHLLPA